MSVKPSNSGDADAGRDTDRVIGEHCHLPAQGLDQLVGHALCMVGVGLRKQHGELVTADPRHDVGMAQALLQESRHSLEHIVAGLVPEGVVDVLEVVDDR